MTTQRIAAQPAALTSIGTHLGSAAAGLPGSRYGRPSTGDATADAALHEFTARWTDHLRGLEEIVRLTARQAQLTALAFRIAGG
ncbi:hypothetical protein ETD86_45600 [Nonomuraea turkmeniaca]|uniref:Uncharacterized protein n=1 Tax=Nonomuraea turkmeniaca TaxID=103838 RepID=A0A5S4EZ51_9ACTN|nr:hypothetical protein [Nonomuraea turkmeniaca]TMR08952.1 hypothetical protein ETD86_45600 [Nonomuraea turkmeniaca]